MYLKYIKINNFRNIKSVSLKLSDKFNFFVGENAQGKTNFLEAVACLSNGRSFRKTSIQDLIKNDAQNALIEGLVNSWNIERHLKISFDSKGRRYWLNGKEIRDLRYYLGNINFIIFSVDFIRIIDGEPKDRRDYIDQIIFNNFPHYLFILKDYKQIVKMKNSVLKSGSWNKEILDVLNEQLIEMGVKIILKRFNVLKEIEKLSSFYYKKLTFHEEKLQIRYMHSFDIEKDKIDDMEYLKKKFKKIIEVNSEREKDRGISLYGPHRDDLDIQLNGKKMKNFCSRGQKRAAIMSMKIAELEYFRKMRGEIPVLILDDIISELDSERRKNIFKYIPDEAQVFWSQNELGDVDLSSKESQVFKIKKGYISF